MRTHAYWDIQKLPRADSRTRNQQRPNLTVLFIVAVKKFVYAHLFGKRNHKPEIIES